MRLSDARTLLLDQVGPAVLAAQILRATCQPGDRRARLRPRAAATPLSSTPTRTGPGRRGTDVAAIRALTRDRAPTRGSPPICAPRACRRRLADELRAAPLARSAPTAPDAQGERDLFNAVRGPLRTLQADLNAERLTARDEPQPRRGRTWPASRWAIAVMIAGLPVRRRVRAAPLGAAPGVGPGGPGARRRVRRCRAPRDGRRAAGDHRAGGRRRLDAPGHPARPRRRTGEQPAPRRADPRPGAVQQRPRAVRLRGEPRPAGAAAQGGELLPAAAAPLRRQAGRAGRPVHRVRRRRRRAHAAADQRPAGVLPGRAHHVRVHRHRARRGRRRGRRTAGARAVRRRRDDRGRARCRWSTATPRCCARCLST